MRFSQIPKPVLIAVGGVLAALFLIGFIGALVDAGTTTETDRSQASDSPAAKAPKPKPSTKSAKPKYDGAAFAEEVEAEVRIGWGGKKITSRCDYAAMTWHCFFDHYESPLKGRIDVHLSFPGDVSQDDAKMLAEKARMDTFNLAGFTIESLEQIVSFNNGVDSGTTNRRDVPLLNR